MNNFTPSISLVCAITFLLTNCGGISGSPSTSLAERGNSNHSVTFSDFDAIDIFGSSKIQVGNHKTLTTKSPRHQVWSFQTQQLTRLFGLYLVLAKVMPR